MKQSYMYVVLSLLAGMIIGSVACYLITGSSYITSMYYAKKECESMASELKILNRDLEKCFSTFQGGQGFKFLLPKNTENQK